MAETTDGRFGELDSSEAAGRRGGELAWGLICAWDGGLSRRGIKSLNRKRSRKRAATIAKEFLRRLA